MAINARKEQLLKLVIENYIERAEPVGSRFLVETSDLSVSGATIRNEMRDLENEGYLTHPHTSAGRIPTQSGYEYYVDNLMEIKPVLAELQAELKSYSKDADKKTGIKKAGKRASEFTKNAVIIAFNPDQVYYTGISNLFSQPEFKDYSQVVDFSMMFDHCEERIADILDSVGRRTLILIGNHNPFGSSCSLVASHFGKNGMFAFLGPMRMDYPNNVSLISFINHTFQHYD